MKWQLHWTFEFKDSITMYVVMYIWEIFGSAYWRPRRENRWWEVTMPGLEWRRREEVKERRVFGHVNFGGEAGRKWYAERGAGGKPLPGNLWNCKSHTGCSSSVFLSDVSFLFLLKVDSDVLYPNTWAVLTANSLVEFFDDAQCVNTKIWKANCLRWSS